MSLAVVGIILALVVGGLRAIELWRMGGHIEVINIAVVTLFAQGRGGESSALLKSSGPAVYLGIATAIAESTRRFVARPREGAGEADRPTSPRARQMALIEHVERDARVALIVATRRLRKRSWFDTITVVCLFYAGIQVAVSGNASTMLVLGMLAGTLLWLSNAWGARHLARRFAVGATALIDGVARALDAFPTPDGNQSGSGEG